MTGIRICFINPDGSKVCLRLPGGGIQPPPIHPGSGATGTSGSTGTPISVGSGKPGGGSGHPIIREDMLADLALISSIHSASSNIADTDLRTAMMKGVEGAVHQLQQKLQGQNVTVELDK